jgi:hypothetical protein
MKNNINGYYIIEDNPTVKIQIELKEEIYLYGMNLIELVLPQCKIINCGINKLNSLIIPDGCEQIYCHYNNLIELILPQSCKKIVCHYNNLTELIIPKSCEIIDCCDNNLKKLILPKNCLYVCKGNKLPLVIENLFSSKDPIKIQLANNLQLASSLQLANNLQK